jgi:glutathione peroxidase
MPNLYDFEAMTIDGHQLPLRQLQGQVVLVVNTASACGFTPQLTGLQALHEQFEQRGLVILGFPCNQFGAQDKGRNDEIARFCLLNHGVRFQMMGKVAVNGANAHPLFQWLRTQAPGWLGSTSIKWNFTKFLVGRDGAAIKRFAPTDKPVDLCPAVEAALSLH